MNRLLAIRLPLWAQALLTAAFVTVMAMSIGGCGGIAPGFPESHDLTITYNGASNATPLAHYGGGTTLTHLAIAALANQQLGSHAAAYIVRPSVTPGSWRVFASDLNTPQIRVEDQLAPASIAKVSMTTAG